MAEAAQAAEQLHAERRADDAAGQQHRAHREVERAAPPMGERARDRGGR